MSEWSIYLEIPHEMTQESAGRIVEAVLERLEPHSAIGGCDAQSLWVRMSIEAQTVDKAIPAARRLFAFALRRAGFSGDAGIVMAEAQIAQQLDKALERSNVPDIVGVAEVSRILKVSRQRVSELARSSDFPRPIVTLASGPIWHRSAIARFEGRWPRRPGRPKRALTHA